MATPVLMPKPGNTVEECILVSWKKKKGDDVTSGEILAEIETDKATFEIESPAAGTILETFFQEGDLVKVYTNTCVVGKPGESAEEFRPKKEAASSKPATQPAPTAKTGAAPSSAATASPGTPIPSSSGTPAPPITDTPSPALPPAQGVLSPRARAFLTKHRFPHEGIVGTGAGGRILESDVKDALRKAKLSSLSRQMVSEGWKAPAAGSGIRNMITADDLEKPPVPLSGIRTKIAERMHTSLLDTAQLTLTCSVGAANLLAFRKKIKAGREKAGIADINLNDMVVFAAIKSLEEFPDFNAEFINGAIHPHRNVDIAFACDTPRGLVVPVIRKSQELTMNELAIRMKAMTGLAKEGKISPDDLSGGSFTVSNLGSMGVETFTPIINYPQVAILGVCTIQLKPVRRNGEIVFVDMLGLSLTINHQVLDGAPGTRFLQILKDKIENIETIANISL